MTAEWTATWSPSSRGTLRVTGPVRRTYPLAAPYPGAPGRGMLLDNGWAGVPGTAWTEHEARLAGDGSVRVPAEWTRAVYPVSREAARRLLDG